MVRVKICGVTNAADARACCSAGANLLGFNFYEKSPRYITAAEGAKVRTELPAEVEAVGVFVNSKAADVVELCRSLHLNAAQLHGDESPEIVSEVARSITVFKAFRVGPSFSLDTFEQYPEAFAFLLDAARAKEVRRAVLPARGAA